MIVSEIVIMFWKIYWFLMLCSSVFYFWEGFSRMWEIIDFIFFLLALIGLFAFSYRKRFITRPFWKSFFLILIVWTVVYQYFIPLSPRIAGIDIGMSRMAEATITILPYVPLFVGLYLYGFKRQFWGKTRQK